MSSKPKFNRRKFLNIAGLTVGASVLVCGGLGAVSSIPPQIEYLETQPQGKDTMPKVLIAYASKAGSTGEVASVMSEVLSAQGMAVDVLQIKHVQNLSLYQAVILGSAIRMSRLLPELVEFVKTNQAILSQKPVAYFVNCLTMKDDTEENRSKTTAYLEPLQALVKPECLGLFGGLMKYSKLSLLDRIIIANLIKAPEGDFRNWSAIRAWAAQALPPL